MGPAGALSVPVRFPAWFPGRRDVGCPSAPGKGLEPSSRFAAPGKAGLLRITSSTPPDLYGPRRGTTSPRGARPPDWIELSAVNVGSAHRSRRLASVLEA